VIKVVYAPVNTQLLPAAQVDHEKRENAKSITGAEDGERSLQALNSAQMGFFIGFREERLNVLIDTKFPLSSFERYADRQEDALRLTRTARPLTLSRSPYHG
jgi:hypothetical protein